MARYAAWLVLSLASIACSEDPATGAGVGGASGSAGTGGTAGSSAGASGSAGSGVDAGAVGCVSSSQLLAMDQPFSCQALHVVEAPIAWLPHDCHTQGIGFDVAGQRFVTTCQDQDGGDSGRVLAFPISAPAGGPWSADAVLELHDDALTPHPSAIQIDAAGGFVVAMARSEPAGPSYLHQLSSTPATLLSLGAPITHAQSHVGAVAFATFDGTAHALGCGWDCATLSLYAAAGGGALAAVGHGPTSDFVIAGVDDNVGAYNSLYLTRRCDDDRPLLFASHEDWLDVWELSGLGTAGLEMSKIVKRKIEEDVVEWQGRPIFYEGMTLEIAEDGFFVWAAPHDFGTESCPAGTRCMQYVYRCRFGQ